MKKYQVTQNKEKRSSNQRLKTLNYTGGRQKLVKINKIEKQEP